MRLYGIQPAAVRTMMPFANSWDASWQKWIDLSLLQGTGTVRLLIWTTVAYLLDFRLLLLQGLSLLVFRRLGTAW